MNFLNRLPLVSFTTFVFFTLLLQTHTSDNLQKLTFHNHNYNCSHYSPILYDVTRLAGTWHYLELFTEDSSFPIDQLFCLKLSVNVKGMDVDMNMTIPKPADPNRAPGISEPAVEILLVANMFGWVDEVIKRPAPGDEMADERRKIEVGTPSIHRISVGRFQLHSLSFASSKWILLANSENEHLLYVACGDFPDGTCAVGEIGILSRGTYIPPRVIYDFGLVLSQYELHTAPRIRIDHDRCLPVPVKVQI